MILDKLDSNISTADKEAMKKIQVEAEEFQKEIQRYLNGNIELSRELDGIKKLIPRMSIDFKNETSVGSVKQPLELMKVFGGKLKTNSLRMNTIKDKLQIMRIQVEKVEEQKAAPVQ